MILINLKSSIPECILFSESETGEEWISLSWNSEEMLTAFALIYEDINQRIRISRKVNITK